MREVLILSLNSKFIHSTLASWYLKSAAEGIADCHVCEHTINESFDTVFKDIFEHAPKVLAISVYIWNVEYVFRLVEEVKKAVPETIIVLGGPEVGYNVESVFEKCPGADYIISGEGEVPFVNLCRFLLHGHNVDFNGISRRADNKIVVSTPYIGEGTPKSPYTSDYFDTLNGRIAYFESSRGCPYSCAYCISGRKEGLRFFDIEYVKTNILLLANSGSKTIKFVDRTFNANKKRAIEIWEFLISESGKSFPHDVCFHFELSGDLLDDESISLLEKSPPGLFQYEIGIQSFCDKTIDVIHRVTDSVTLKNRIKKLVSMENAHIHTDLIAGLPYENLMSFKDSFNQAYELGADMLQLGFLKLLHGTELSDLADKYGFKYLDKPPYEVFETAWMSNDDIKLLKIVENAVDRIHNSGRFKRTLKWCVSHFETPFEMFYLIGSRIRNLRGLDDITDSIFSFLAERFPDDREEIRDNMVLDRLSTNSSKKLPDSLYISDQFIGVIKKFLNASPETAEKTGVRRSIVILYHSNQVVYVDYSDRNFKDEYRLNFILMEKIKNEKN